MERIGKVLAVCMLLTGGLPGQLRTGMPHGILEGRIAAMGEGKVYVVLEGGQELVCSVDGRTYIDRERQRLGIKDLKAGDLLELVTERQGVGATCFARMIHVVNGEKRFGGRGKVGSVKRATESFAPRGSLLVTGVVRDLQQSFLEIKTRQDGPMRFRLRADTVFVRNGVEVLAADLDRTGPVFVRAGYDLNGELEVFQVSWGAIVQPQTRLPRP
jgi:hypothetical protein